MLCCGDCSSAHSTFVMLICDFFYKYITQNGIQWNAEVAKNEEINQWPRDNASLIIITIFLHCYYSIKQLAMNAVAFTLHWFVRFFIAHFTLSSASHMARNSNACIYRNVHFVLFVLYLFQSNWFRCVQFAKCSFAFVLCCNCVSTCSCDDDDR